MVNNCRDPYFFKIMVFSIQDHVLIFSRYLGGGFHCLFNFVPDFSGEMIDATV